jgi:hypothetical protein
MSRIKQYLNGFLDSGTATAKSHTHLQSRHPNFTKTVKEYVFANASKFAEKKARQVTMYKKHRTFVLNRKVCEY